MQTILVTGASTGIGRRVAALLAGRGYRVFGTSRNPKTDRLDGFELIPLDVTSDDSAAACIQTVIERAGRIDVLVNNAGIDFMAASEEASMDQIRAVMETNFFGVVRMTNAVLPHMRAQGDGLIINMSSLAGLGGVPYQGIYSASKHALEGYTESLLYELEPFNIRLALVEPGYYRSEINQRMETGAHPIDAYAQHEAQARVAFARALDGGPDPLPVAETVLAIVEGRSRRLRHPVGVETTGVWLKHIVPEAMVWQRIRWMTNLDDLYSDIWRRLPGMLAMGLLMLVFLIRRR